MDELKVESRLTRGKRNARRQRNAGSVPAVLYGHGEEVLSLSVPADQIGPIIKHGARLVMLAGAVDQQAFIRDVQWNTWGTHVIHVDFTRISGDERIEVRVAVELRGEAPGRKEGGVVEHLLHLIQLECAATSIPEKLVVNINDLNLDQTITANQLEIPEGAKIVGNPEAIVVQCVEPTVAPDEEEGDVVEAEPEVIGRKAEEGETED